MRPTCGSSISVRCGIRSSRIDPDAMNFGPRAGFAWTLNDAETTVVRGGVGFLYSPHLIATVRQSAANPFIPFRIVYNRTEVAPKSVKWPMYTDDMAVFALRDAGGQRTVFSVFDPDMQVPYTIQSMLSVQHSLGRTMAAEVGYLRTDGNDFPLQRQFTQAFDRETGVRPNPSLGAPGGYYVDSSQTMVYNGLQTSLQKAVLESVFLGRELHVRQERGDAGRRPLGVLHRRVREQPGLLGSRIRPRAVEQRHPPSA